MRLIDFDLVADFLAEDPVDRMGVLAFGVTSWVVAVVQTPPQGIIQSLIQIIPPILGIWVANRSMQRAHELRMEKLRQKKAEKPPETDTVDVP